MLFMEIKNMFSAEEWKLMNDYIKRYGTYGQRTMPLEQWLEHWYNAKAKFLLPLFNNKLVWEHEVQLKDEEFRCEIMSWMRNSSELFPLFRRLNRMKDYIYASFNCSFATIEPLQDLIYTLSMSSECWLKNSFSKNIVVEINGVKFKAQKGQKVMSVIRSFCRSYTKLFPGASEEIDMNLSDSINTIANEYSAILNKKRNSSTKLRISIHPLDYLTMSDNNYSWESCMRWTSATPQEAGCYRVGTISCMNNPYTVVAYIEGDKKWYPLGENYISWSNKKWRELFIVNPSVVAAVKGYPYSLPSMEKYILNRLGEMTAALTGNPFDFTTIEMYSGGIDFPHPYVGGVSFYSGLMYDDLDGLTTPAILIADKKELFNTYREIEYGSAAYCPVCGDHLEEGPHTCCPSCIALHTCDWCGEYLPEEGGHVHTDRDGVEHTYCTHCYERLMSTCNHCGERGLSPRGFSARPVVVLKEDIPAEILDKLDSIRLYRYRNNFLEYSIGDSICDDCLAKFTQAQDWTYLTVVSRYLYTAPWASSHAAIFYKDAIIQIAGQETYDLIKDWIVNIEEIPRAEI